MLRALKNLEIQVTLIAIVVFAIGLVGHIAGAFFLAPEWLGYIAAPVPFIIALITYLAYKYAEKYEYKGL